MPMSSYNIFARTCVDEKRRETNNYSSMALVECRYFEDNAKRYFFIAIRPGSSIFRRTDAMTRTNDRISAAYQLTSIVC